MSELKVYVKPIKTNMFGKMIVGQSYYLKSEADKVIEEKDEKIAELKAENERLKATPEEIMKEVFDKMLIYPHDMVRFEDAYHLAVSLRKTKRALYKVCANWAWAEHVRYVDISDGSQGYKQVQERWEKMASKCIKKAREYR